jgi:hypothetical protein
MIRPSGLRSGAAAFVAVGSLALGPVATAAQVRRLSDSSDSVPRALADALLDPIGMMRVVSGGRPRLVVGALPTGLAQRLWVPVGASVLGGIESSGLGVAVIHSTMTQDSLLAGYRREQVRLGWSPPNNAGNATFGFVPAPTSGLPTDRMDGVVFCSTGTTLTIIVAAAEPGMSEIRATAVNNGADVCRPAPPRPVIAADYPTLVNPPGTGAGFAPGCPSWNYASGGGTTRLQSSVPLDSILAFYGRQLTAVGWTATAGETATRSWIHRDSAQRSTELTLMARSENGCVEVRMDVRGRR